MTNRFKSKVYSRIDAVKLVQTELQKSQERFRSTRYAVLHKVTVEASRNLDVSKLAYWIIQVRMYEINEPILSLKLRNRKLKLKHINKIKNVLECDGHNVIIV